MNVITNINENGIIAILRGQPRENILPIMEALRQGGIRLVEVTADTFGAPDIIEEAVLKFEDSMCIGAGTVLDPETAKMVIQSGAQFVISPTSNINTIHLTKRYGVISIPAAMTPTEMLTAYEAGADYVKLFPANSLGAGYLKDVKGPLSQIPIIATGGINVNNMKEYFEAGAVGVGVGGSLVKGNLKITDEELKNIASQASMYVKTFEKIKENKGTNT